MTTREIVVLGHHLDKHFETIIKRLSGWRIDTFEIHALEQQTAIKNNAQIGLFIINTSINSEQLQVLENYLRKKAFVLWVGLIDGAMLNQAKTRQLIADYAFDYHTLPIDPLRLHYTLGHACGMAELHGDTPEHNLHCKPPVFIGNSKAMQKVKHLINRLANTNAGVLISGDSGTGKEMAARELHRKSFRHKKPFVVVNCAALPESLIQSELFGFEKGAFTGASHRRIGKIEAANSGTLFLDEIGELPLSQQTSLLRFLQDGIIERVGGRASIHVDARIIAATHINLGEAIAAQRFREDLFYRINVINIHLPPLRKRSGDILDLAEFYLHAFCRERHSKLRFSSQSLDCINHYQWPGNIRELRNKILHAVTCCQGTLIQPLDLQLEDSPQIKPQSLSVARAQADIDAIQASLQYTRNNISQASRVLEISRPALYKLLSKYELEIKSGDQLHQSTHKHC